MLWIIINLMRRNRFRWSYKLFITNSGSILIFENMNNAIPIDRNSTKLFHRIEERNVLFETKVPRDGATQPVNHPNSRQIFISSTDWNLKLIRVDFQRTCKKNVQRRANARHLYGEGNRLEEKWGAKVAARFDAILNYSFNEANRTGLK